MTRALKYIQENPEGTQQVMMNWLKLDREMAADIYQMAKNNYTKTGMVEESVLNSLVTTMLAKAGIKNVAPTTRLRGSTRRYDAPASRRTACGMITPTNPISPLTLTTAAVPIVAAITLASWGTGASAGGDVAAVGRLGDRRTLR